MDALLAEAELNEGDLVRHADFADFRAKVVEIQPERGKALVRVLAGWTCEPPKWPVSVPLIKLEVL